MSYNKKTVENVGKFMAYILRHGATAEGLTLDSQGWLAISDLMAKAQQHGYLADNALLEHVVATDKKGRYQISSDGQRVRAVQGHSERSVSIDFKQVEPPEFLWHGTTERFLDSILASGLEARTRLYVHLSEDLQTAIAVGSRHGKVAMLKINARQMYQQGHPFSLSDNNVWLVKAVPVEFISLESI